MRSTKPLLMAVAATAAIAGGGAAIANAATSGTTTSGTTTSGTTTSDTTSATTATTAPRTTTTSPGQSRPAPSQGNNGGTRHCPHGGNGPANGTARAYAAVLAVPKPSAAPSTVTIVEFYHAGLDHYFITGNANEIADLDNPVELFHVVRSHDACLVCTVHLARGRSFTL